MLNCVRIRFSDSTVLTCTLVRCLPIFMISATSLNPCFLSIESIPMGFAFGPSMCTKYGPESPVLYIFVTRSLSFSWCVVPLFIAVSLISLCCCMSCKLPGRFCSFSLSTLTCFFWVFSLEFSSSFRIFDIHHARHRGDATDTPFLLVELTRFSGFIWYYSLPLYVFITIFDDFSVFSLIW